MPQTSPEWALLHAGDAPLELDGTPVKIHPTRWPVGYHRQKDVFTIIQEVIYVGAGVFLVPWFLSKPGAEGWGYLCLLLMLVNISWLEWSSRCEDRVRVQRAAIVINVALAATAVPQHEVAKQQREARAIKGEYDRQEACGDGCQDF